MEHLKTETECEKIEEERGNAKKDHLKPDKRRAIEASLRNLEQIGVSRILIERARKRLESRR